MTVNPSSNRRGDQGRAVEFDYGEWALVMAADRPEAAIDPARVPERFQGVIEEMRSAEPTMRRRVMGEWIAAQPDAEALGGRIDAVGPDDPAPADKAETIPTEGETWPPLRIAELPDAAPFPLDALPPALTGLATEGAESIGCPPDFIAVSGLVMASAAIGRSTSLMLQSSYFARAALYAAIVDVPGGGKSHAVELATEPARRFGEQFERDHEKAMESWRESAAEAKANKEPIPPKPRARRFDVDDITTERLIDLLSEEQNERGLLMVRDELASLFVDMNKYRSGKGSDRQTYCTIWSGKTFIRDRVGTDSPIAKRCKHPHLAIVGGMVPDLLAEMGDGQGRQDGFRDRFLICFPDTRPSPESMPKGVEQRTRDNWAALVNRLWLRQMATGDNGPCPRVVTFSGTGREAWDAFYRDHAREMNDPAFPPHLKGTWAKLREYAGRLVLVVALMRDASDSDSDPYKTPDAEARDVEAARKLVDYFKSHLKRAVAHAGPATPSGDAMRAMLAWLKAKGLTSFTERDVKQAREWIDADTLKDALELLAKRNAIRPIEAANDSPKGGRPRSPSYEVNPELLDLQNLQNPQNP